MKLLILPLVVLYACIGAMCQQHQEPTPAPDSYTEVNTFIMVENHTGLKIEVQATVGKQSVSIPVGTEEQVVLHELGFPWVEIKMEVCAEAEAISVSETTTGQTETLQFVDVLADGGFMISVWPTEIKIDKGYAPM